MKQIKYALCVGILVIISVAVLLFLNIFTAEADRTANYIEFDSYAVKNTDGSLSPLTADEFYAITPQTDQTYVFTAVVTEDNYDDYIMFTPTGMDITVFLGDTEVYRSDSLLPEEIIDQITARIPIRGSELPLTVTMECQPLGGANTVFPPMLLTTSDMTDMIAHLSYGHRGGIPAGAFAVMLLLLTALFLYSIAEGKPQFSMIALIIASLILMIRGISTESGYLFLPEWINTVCSHSGLLWLLLGAFLLYFATNIKRLRLFGGCALISAVIFIAAYLISLASDGAFAAAAKEYFIGWIEYGEYTRPMYWIILWLQIVCLSVALGTTVQSISQHIAGEQAMKLKAELAMENYRVIEAQSKRDAELRHEFKNQMAALGLMLAQNKTEEAKQYLSKLEEQNFSTEKYTENFAINAILQNAAAKAKKQQCRFEAYARVEKDPNIPEEDLCGLLFNLIDNALDAASQIEDTNKRRITIRIKQRESTLGIYCANSFAKAPTLDRNGNLQSSKTKYGHGLGIAQMERIAKKYGSKLDFSYSEDTFITQTALFLPQKESE